MPRTWSLGIVALIGSDVATGLAIRRRPIHWGISPDRTG
jgi:hypothetical protein